jgi:murein tripeptide amidase MpaA
VPNVAFDRYYKFEELTELLNAFAAEFPNLVALSSIGKSHEGRDIWMVTVTDSSTGAHDTKPAYWCDATIHASELSPGTAVLYLLNKLCTQCGSDETVTRALRSRTFYLVPRVSPDGAEWAMETPPRIVRSGTRAYPFVDEDVEGLERIDVDGDDRILSMRIEDPNGPWKISDEEPRLLTRRKAGESGGTYYRVLPEGLFHHFDGMKMRARRVTEGLDFNRNFPSAWRPESEQHGAGLFPTSEPEIHSLVQAFSDRPNITGAVCFHTFSGVHLRPPSRYPDDDMAPEDLWVFKDFGKEGEAVTGYPAISNFHEFKYHPKEVITGVFDDWAYEHRGVFAWTTEIWSPQRQAGITDYKYIDWFRDHPFEDDLKLLKWSDEKLDGKGYVDWYPFEHPQLGKVEIGGWDMMHAFRNPPPQFLEAEVAPFSDWVIWMALSSPKLELREVRVEGSRVRVAVQNTGYLPTNVTHLAIKKKMLRGVRATINRDGEPLGKAGSARPDWLIGGSLTSDAGQLTGWSHVSVGGFGWQTNGTDDVAVFEWVLANGKYDIQIEHERAGKISVEVRVD